MTTLIVEDGTVVANANTYVTTADLVSYVSDRGITLSSDTTQLLIKAMDYIEGLPFQGIKQQINQPLQFPRYRLYIDGYPLLSSTIPIQLKNGQMQTAIAIDQGNNPLQDQPRSVTKEKIGPIEVDYSLSSSALTINVEIMNSVYKLLQAGGSSNSLRVNKS